MIRRCIAALLVAAVLPAQGACDDDLFVDRIGAAEWIDVDVEPAQGTAGIRDALRRAQQDFPSLPLRIQLAPGTYADNLGSEIFAQALWRSAQAPLWLRARDGRPDATVLGQGLNLLGASFVVIEGLTIGPAQVGAWDGQRHADPQPLQAAAGIHVAGAALDGQRPAVVDGALDATIYGRYVPAHHIVVRRVTVQNLFDLGEREAETSDSPGMDGMKFNQVEDLWVLDSRVSQTTRHGIDNVGVHRAAFCRNLVSRTGGGLGIEAKGGSTDVLYDGNTFHRVRRVELGGEGTDATYYFSGDGRWDYEALRVTARNNLIVDAREAALEFSGCQDCSAVYNTIYFSPGYAPPADGGTIGGGDAIRVHDSRTLAAEDGAGNDCPTWDPALGDHVTVDLCWGLGARAPAPVHRALRSARLLVANNLFVADAPLFGRSGSNGGMPCPLNRIDGDAVVTLDANLWWNGGDGLPEAGCSAMAEGPHARRAVAGEEAMPLAGGRIDDSSLARIGATVIDALLPRPGGTLQAVAIDPALQPLHDRLGAPRDGSTGALVGTLSDADRLFNWAEATYPEIFSPPAASRRVDGDYGRQYPASSTQVGIRGGRLLVAGPLFGPQVLDLGMLPDWATLALAAGY